MSAILLTTDLMTASKIAGAAQRAGCALKTVANPDALCGQIEQHNPLLVILDLSTPGVDLAALVPQLRSFAGRPEILAFGPHVHEDKLRAAAEAGCDAVLARGQFHAQAEQILARLVSDGVGRDGD